MVYVRDMSDVNEASGLLFTLKHELYFHPVEPTDMYRYTLGPTPLTK